MKPRKGFLRVRCVGIYRGDPKWARKLGEVVLDVKVLPFKPWFVLAMVFGGFKDLKVEVIP